MWSINTHHFDYVNWFVQCNRCAHGKIQFQEGVSAYRENSYMTHINQVLNGSYAQCFMWRRIFINISARVVNGFRVNSTVLMKLVCIVYKRQCNKSKKNKTIDQIKYHSWIIETLSHRYKIRMRRKKLFWEFLFHVLWCFIYFILFRFDLMPSAEATTQTRKKRKKKKRKKKKKTDTNTTNIAREEIVNVPSICNSTAIS